VRSKCSKCSSTTKYYDLEYFKPEHLLKIKSSKSSKSSNKGKTGTFGTSGTNKKRNVPPVKSLTYNTFNQQKKGGTFGTQNDKRCENESFNNPW